MDLEALCRIVEKAFPSAKANCILEMNQIVVTFSNRPDVEIALLSPWFQSQIKSGRLKEEDVDTLIEDLEIILNNPV